MLLIFYQVVKIIFTQPIIKSNKARRERTVATIKCIFSYPVLLSEEDGLATGDFCLP